MKPRSATPPSGAAPSGSVGGEESPPVGRGLIGRFSLAWLGFWMANLVPLQLLLPSQLADMALHHKVQAFAILNAVSAVVALIPIWPWTRRW